jgi:hypothetical protein
MSESEYRDTREAARARVASLEEQLRDHDASATKIPTAPEESSADQKKKIRDELALATKARRIPLWIGIALCVASFKHAIYVLMPNAFYQAAQPGTNGIFIVLFLIGAAIAFAANRPGAKEREKERELRALIKIEDAEYARFRVKTSAIQKRVDVEAEERERIERELDEARTLAEPDEKRS